MSNGIGLPGADGRIDEYVLTGTPIARPPEVP